jgi:hypothetical protein
MTIQEIIEAIEAKSVEAEEAMREAEANGYAEYDYHEGRYEALSATAAWLTAQFYAGPPADLT